jgi:signal transduction histidine kinase
MGVIIDNLFAFSRIERLDNPERNVHGKNSDFPKVKGDPSLLRLMLVNLISNALKFMRVCYCVEIEIGCIQAEGRQKTFFLSGTMVWCLT